MMTKNSILIFLMLLAGTTVSFNSDAQFREDPYRIDQYGFVRYDLNRIRFFSDSSAFDRLFDEFDDLLKKGEGQIRIVHIGGSHLQADVYSDRLRKRLQDFEPGLNGGRGFVFPYRVAHTNNPSNFRVDAQGKWTSCRNVEKKKDCVLGLSGISVSTRDPRASLSFWLPDKEPVEYEFNRVRIFCKGDSLSYDLYLDAKANVEELPGPQEGIRVFQLDRYVDSVTVRLVQTDSIQEEFEFFGISLETEDPGFVYDAIGVNGAKVPSYLRCQLLSEHVRALDPDLVILSMGTNDAYGRYFDSVRFEKEYDSLVGLIREAVPSAAILLTVPNDSYLYRRYINRNTEEVEDALFRMAKQHGYGVWDFYRVMGGLNSIVVWQRWGLARRDRIHFTHKGYVLQGDLLFNALLRAYDDHLEQKNRHAATGY